MKRIVVFGIAATLLVAATSASAQERERRGPQGPRMSSVQVLLDNADELDLSVEQIDAFEAVQSDLAEKAGPTMTKLDEMRAQGDMRSRRDEVRPLMEELQTANREAEAAALALLSEEQRAHAEDILEAHRQEARQRMRGRDRRN